MKRNSTFKKTGLAIIVIIAMAFSANATVYTATTSGNFSASGTWTGGVAPSFNLTTADEIIINTGVTVTLDQDLTINNATAQLSILGTLSGTHSVTILNGSLSGAVTGMLQLHNLTLSSSSTSTFTGSATVDNLYNSEAILSLTGNTHVNDTLVLVSGVAEIGSGISLTLSNGATIELMGGTYNSTGGGSLSLSGNVNLYYNGTNGILSTSAETSLSNINNVTVNMAGGTELTLTGNLTVNGQLSIRNGDLNMDAYTLTLNGTIDSTATGTLSGTTSSNLVLSGSGNMGTLTFTSGQGYVNNLTINGGSGSWVSLASSLTAGGDLTLTNGNINLTGASNLTLTGSDSIQGGSSNSYVVTGGSGSLVVAVNGSSSVDNSRTLYIGTQTSFAPVRVTNSSSTSGNFSGNAHAGIFADGTSGTDLSATRSSVNTSWNVESDITSGANVALTAYWNQSAEVNSFSSSDVYLSHYTNGAWDATATGQATSLSGGMMSVTRAGITSFSPFAVFSGYAAGINTVANNTTFSSYPNPAQNTMTVSVNPNTTNNIKVYDVLGNQVAVYPVRGASTTIDISSLTSGVYFLSVNNATQKFVKE